MQRIWIPLIPQSCRGELGTLSECGELGPDDRGRHGVVDKGEGRKATIGTGNHPLAPNDVGVMADPLRNQPRMLDEIRRRIDDPGDQDLVIGNFLAAQQNPVAPSVVWAKFAALAEGARIATDRLWRGAAQ